MLSASDEYESASGQTILLLRLIDTFYGAKKGAGHQYEIS